MEETPLDGVLLRRRGRVREIVLNEPARRNPMSPAIMAGLDRACDAVEADEDARAVILTGAGPVFCAGGDLPYNDAHLTGDVERQRAFLTALYRPFLRILDLPMPTIAAVNGAAVGGGFGLAMLCDMRLCQTATKFVTAFAPMGFAPGMGLAFTLERAVGLSRAAELLYSGRVVRGEEAVALGIALEAVAADSLMERAREMAQAMAETSAVVNRHVKAGLFGPHRAELRARLERDILAQVLTSVGEDYRARRAAMPTTEKRDA